MNTVALAIYLVEVVSSLNGLLNAVVILMGLGLVLFFVAFFATVTEARHSPDEFSAVKQFGSKHIKWYVPVFVVAIICAVLIPPKDTIYVIIGAHYGEEVLTSDGAREIGTKGLEYIDGYLDQKVREIREGASEAMEEGR